MINKHRYRLFNHVYDDIKTVKEKYMKRQNVFFITFICFILLGFTFFSCNDLSNNNESNDDSKTVIFSIEKIDTRSFKVIVNGANWTSIASTEGLTWFYNLLKFTIQITDSHGTSDWDNNIWASPFNIENNSSNVRTFILDSNYTNIVGTVILVNTYLDVGYLMTDGDYNANYIIDNEKSIVTF